MSFLRFTPQLPRYVPQSLSLRSSGASASILQTIMNSFHSIIAVLLISTAHTFADLVPDPAAKAVGAVDLETYRLYQRLVGTSWNYTYKGHTNELTFGQGGAITFQWWPGATWRITSPNSVAIKNPKLGEMPVHFNAEFKKFTAKDWSGGDATGTLRNPNAKVTK
jgi:hypothetical protein